MESYKSKQFGTFFTLSDRVTYCSDCLSGVPEFLKPSVSTMSSFGVFSVFGGSSMGRLYSLILS